MSCCRDNCDVCGRKKWCGGHGIDKDRDCTAVNGWECKKVRRLTSTERDLAEARRLLQETGDEMRARWEAVMAATARAEAAEARQSDLHKKWNAAQRQLEVARTLLGRWERHEDPDTLGDETRAFIAEHTRTQARRAE